MNETRDVHFLSVVIPAYNEGDRIEGSVRQTAQFLQSQPYRWEIIVVDDGSRDRTSSVVKSLIPSHPSLRLITHITNQGKGRAVQTGLKAAEGEAILLADADGATPVEELHRLLPYLENGAELVTGSRRMPGSLVQVAQGPLRKFMGDTYQFLCRRILGLPLTDFTCGFKLMTRAAAAAVAPRMRIARWSFDAEIFTMARIHRLCVVEVPIRWADQRKSKVRLLKDALGSFLELLKIRAYQARGVYR